MGFETLTLYLSYKDGSFTIQFAYPLDEWVYGMILSYGPFAVVNEPPAVRTVVAQRLKQAAENY